MLDRGRGNRCCCSRWLVCTPRYYRTITDRVPGERSRNCPFWSLPTISFAGIAAAASIGLISTLGRLGAFAGPCMIGSTNETGGNFSRGLSLVGSTLIVSAVTFVAMRFAPKAMLPQDCQTGKVS